MKLHFATQDLMIFGAAAAFVVIVYLLIGSSSSYQSKLRKRAQKLKERKVVVPKAVQDAASLRRKQHKESSRLVEMLMHPLPNFDKLNDLLERTGSQLRAKQFILRSILFTLTCGLLTAAMGKGPLLGVSVGLIFGLWLPVKILKFKVNKHMKNFLRLFPDGIDLIVRGLRSGLPVTESINLVAKEVPEPVGGIFKHVADTMQLGVPMEKALQEMAKKLNSTEFNFFTTSIILQRETGGNLSEILDNLSEVLRKRYMMKMKIKAMTSEARASSMIIGALPFLVSGVIFLMSPKYIGTLISDYRGNIALGVALGMLFTGVWAMNRMAKFEI